MSKLLFCKLLALTAALIFNSCSKRTDWEVKFKIGTVSLSRLDNTGRLPEISNADSSNAKSFGIRIHLDPTVTKDIKNFDVNEAYVNCENGIKSMTITSNSSFGNNSPPGAILNYKFYQFQGNYSGLKRIEPDKAISVSNEDYDDYKTNYIPEHFDILLMDPPAGQGKHSFRITLELSDGTIQSDTTRSVWLY